VKFFITLKCKKLRPSCVSVQDPLGVDVMQGTANHGENTPQLGHFGEKMEKGKKMDQWCGSVDKNSINYCVKLDSRL